VPGGTVTGSRRLTTLRLLSTSDGTRVATPRSEREFTVLSVARSPIAAAV
jgi:hypothetical protein